MKPRKQLTLILFVCLCTISSVHAQSQGDIVDRLDKALGVSLPDEYQKPVKAFVQSDEIMQHQTAALFTEQFIEEQMKVSWGIDRQNQLLFVWDAIYEQVAEKNFYDGEDGNQKRLDDFEMALDSIEACGEKYKEGFIAYMNQVSAEAQQRSAEARQQSAEATNDGLIEMVRFYYLYNKNPDLVKQEEIDISRGHAQQWIIPGCRKYDIDYRSILLKELGDQKKVDNLLKFYGVE